MKTARIFITLLVSASAFLTVCIVSCKKNKATIESPDPCKDFNCLNGGVCLPGTLGQSLGDCSCPDGFKGKSCEIVCPTKDQYMGRYIGTNDGFIDTVFVFQDADAKVINVFYNISNSYDTFRCNISGCGYVGKDTLIHGQDPILRGIAVELDIDDPDKINVHIIYKTPQDGVFDFDDFNGSRQ